MKKFLSARKYGSAGSTLTEFAIGFPILMTLILLLVDAGLYLFQKSIVTDTTARLNRAIVTQLGQKEAEAAKCDILPLPPSCSAPTCLDLLKFANAKKKQIALSKGVLFDGMKFKLGISSNADIPYRLITTTGSKEFQCLTCKFLPFISGSPPIITHRSVLVIERLNFNNISSCDAQSDKELTDDTV